MNLSRRQATLERGTVGVRLLLKCGKVVSKNLEGEASASTAKKEMEKRAEAWHG
jgi:hypothetical protein